MYAIFTRIYQLLKKPLFQTRYEKKDGITYWRERILHFFSLVTLYLGFVVLIPSVIASFRSNIIFIAVLDIIVYLYLVFIFTSNKISFTFRVNNLLIVIYLLSIILLLVLGFYGAGFIWLFTVPLLAGLLFGLVAAIRANLVNMLSLIIIGYVIHLDPGPFLRISDYSIEGYTAVSTNFLALNILFSLCTGVLLDGLDKSIKEEQKLKRTIEHEKNVMEQLKDKAEKSEQVKTSFLTNISHDLRTPLNAIIGFSQLLSTKKVDKAIAERYYSIILSQSQSLLHLINDIIDIAKLEAEEIQVLKKPFDLPSLLTEVIDFFRNQLLLKPNNHKEITLHVNSRVPEIIDQDPHKLKQILMNLVANAIKFTPKGKIEVGVDLKDSQSLLFFVKDSGIGIPPEKQEIIFERFRQVDESTTKSVEGAGLGLSICKSMVVLLGGEIWVESTINKGTTFYFSLPVNV